MSYFGSEHKVHDRFYFSYILNIEVLSKRIASPIFCFSFVFLYLRVQDRNHKEKRPTIPSFFTIKSLITSLSYGSIACRSTVDSYACWSGKPQGRKNQSVIPSEAGISFATNG